MSYCLSASCLAHRERVFWNPYFGQWTHTSSRPCEAMAGQPDPTELRCAYCGQRTEVDGAGRLWTYLPDSTGRWEYLDGHWRWFPERWTDACPPAPGGLHTPVLGASQAAG